MANLNCAQFFSTILTGNSALMGDGGAMYLGAVSNFIAINGSTMTLNQAGGRGGSMIFVILHLIVILLLICIFS